MEPDALLRLFDAKATENVQMARGIIDEGGSISDLSFIPKKKGPRASAWAGKPPSAGENIPVLKERQANSERDAPKKGEQVESRERRKKTTQESHPYFMVGRHTSPKNKYVSKKREAAKAILADVEKRDEAVKAMLQVAENRGSNTTANNRVLTFCDIVLVAYDPWGEEAIVGYIAAAILVPYKNIEATVSDVLSHPQSAVTSAGAARMRAIVSRLKRKGVLGDKAQKKPVTLDMIEKTANRKAKAMLLLAFYGGLRKSEAALISFNKAEKRPHIKCEWTDGALLLDMSGVVLKSNQIRHVRILYDEQSDLSIDLFRDELSDIELGDIESGKLVKEYIGEEPSSHSLRSGCCIALVDCGVTGTIIALHLRWAGTMMVNYYARFRARYGRAKRIVKFAQ